ncbi:hypothetical protein ACP8YP_23190, partial [Escherichia coli]
TFQNHTNRPLTDFGGKTSIFSHPVYLFLREFSLQDSRDGSKLFLVILLILFLHLSRIWALIFDELQLQLQS